MIRLKADLHTHTADDPCDPVQYSAEMLIDAVAQLNIEVLAIACHKRVVQTPWLFRYANERNVLLVPAVELFVEGKHVVILNPDEKQAMATTFTELRALGRRDGVIMAPHPFYPEQGCLGRKLLEHIDLFDAIEFSSVYYYFVGMNRRAMHVARNNQLPLIGTTDTHTLPYCDSTFSWLTVEERSVDAVIHAIRMNRVDIETRSRPLTHVMKLSSFYLHGLTCRH